MAEKTTTRNPKYASDDKSKGFAQGGIPSKNPTEAHLTEAIDTPPERESNVQKEDKGS